MNLVERKSESVGLFLLLALFLFYSLQNTLISSDWALLPLRAADDFAMQYSVRRMQNALLSGNFATVITFFDYAYGGAHWLMSALLLLPFRLFHSTQLFVIAARELSVVFGFGSAILVGQISKRILDNTFLRYCIMIWIAVMPVFGQWVDRFHVNMQSVFLGLLSLYFLLREQRLGRRDFLLSAAFIGLAVGFKVLSALIAPLLAGFLLCKLGQQVDHRYVAKQFGIYAGVSLALALVCARFELIGFVVRWRYLRDTISMIKVFAHNGTPEGPPFSPWALFSIGVGNNYLPLPVLAVVLALFARLIWVEWKERVAPLSLCFFVTLLIATLIVTLGVRKVPDYTAAYLLSVGLLVPLGLLGFATLPIPRWAQNGAAVGLMLAAVTMNWQSHLNKNARPLMLLKDPGTQAQLRAFADMKRLVPPKRPLTVVRDFSTVFPYTAFDEGVQERVNFSNLIAGKDQAFDYVVLNKRFWATDGPAPTESFARTEGLEGLQLEAALRQRLEQKRELFGTRYALIYDANDVELFQRVD